MSTENKSTVDSRVPCWAFKPISTALSMNSMTFTKSSSLNEREVNAGAPARETKTCLDSYVCKNNEFVIRLLKIVWIKHETIM